MMKTGTLPAFADALGGRGRARQRQMLPAAIFAERH
jgi:hypothetical protein